MTDLNDNERAIRAANESWADAIRSKDIDALMEHYTEDVVVFDMPPPLSKTGKENYRKSFENWLAQFKGEITCEFKDLEILAGDNVAFLHTLTKVGDIRPDGSDSGSWVRVTVGFRKIDGRWLVTHEHVSIPAGMGGEGS